MATPEVAKIRVRRERTEADPRYQSADEALQAKHEQMAEYLNGGKLAQLKVLRPKSEK